MNFDREWQIFKQNSLLISFFSFISNIIWICFLIYGLFEQWVIDKEYVTTIKYSNDDVTEIKVNKKNKWLSFGINSNLNESHSNCALRIRHIVDTKKNQEKKKNFNPSGEKSTNSFERNLRKEK